MECAGTEPGHRIVDRLARRVVASGMATPAVFLLEMHRPFSFLASQYMYLMAPFASVVFPRDEYASLAALFERREGIELLIRRIEELEAGAP
jgi:hypothetical protein